MNLKTNVLSMFFSTPRGFIYSAMTILILISWVTQLGLIKWVAIAFLAYSIVNSAIENFACVKCGLGLIASLAIVLVAFEIINPRFYILSFLLMIADAWVHAAG